MLVYHAPVATAAASSSSPSKAVAQSFTQPNTTAYGR